MRYLDSCVPIDYLTANPAPGWDPDDAFCFSALLGVETRRTFRVLHAEGLLSAEALADALSRIAEIESVSEVVPITQPILQRASGPFPATLRTLDALHLATALILRERRYPDLVFATHDRRLALAARLMEFQVAGIER